jgi:FkbM family methyltransferase
MTSGTLKLSIQNILKRVGVYQRIKASRLYDLYWSLADRKLLDGRAREVEFYRITLQGFKKGGLIYDIGANHGTKTDIFLRLGAKVVSVEPDETNQEVLRQKFHKLRITPKQVNIVGKAVSEKGGKTTLWIEKPGSAKNTLSSKWVEALGKDATRFGQPLYFPDRKEVESITLERLIADYGIPFFIKIDVEGHELSVLKGMKRPVPYLSFEVNLPDFKQEGIQCLKLLNSIDSQGMFNFTADCRHGLDLERWMPLHEFEQVFERLDLPSLEVFWKTPIR